jgi:signal transduction histidine kinase
MLTPAAMHRSGALQSWLTRSAIAAVAWAGFAIAGLAAYAATDAPGPREPLRSIAAILALPPAEIDAEPEAVVRGVVTTACAPAFVIEDAGSAIFIGWFGHVEADGTAAPIIEPGMILEIEGRVIPGGYVPTLKGRRTRVVGRGPVPPPMPADLGRLSRGDDQGRRVTVRGVVRGIGERLEGLGDSIPILMLDVDNRPLAICCLGSARSLDLRRLVDAEVQVTGVGAGFRNSRGQFSGPSIDLVDPADIDILVPPPADPFAGEIAPLETFARYSAQPDSGHRIRTEGTVSYASPGLLYLQEGSAAVRVDLAPVAADAGAAEPPLAPGDRAQVAGFLDMSRSVAGLSFAVARRVGSGPAPEPEALAVAEIARVAEQFRKVSWMTKPGSHDGRLVRCTGVVETLEKSPAGLTATLSSPGGRWFAMLAPGPSAAALPQLAVGSTVAVAGILRLDLDGARINGLIVDCPTMSQITLLARDAADIEVVRAAPWWTPRRLGVAVFSLAAAAAALAAWSVTLGREVRRQTALAVEEAVGRRAAAAEFEATLRERNRLAVNLHDTVLQWLTGVDFQLKACESARGREDEATLAPHLAVARQMIAHAAGQVRGTVWSLRSVTADGVPFEESLVRLIDQAAAGHDAHVSLSIAPDLPDLPPLVAGNLLLVLQEAIHNALHHAAPSSVRVSVAADRAAGDVVAEVRDDGRGFTVGEQIGPAQGHFGLDVMRERSQRLGGSLAVVSAPGEGTSITVRVPRTLTDPAPLRAALNGRSSPDGLMTGAG